MSWIKRSIIIFVPFFVGFISLEAGIRLIHTFMLMENKIQYSQYTKIYSDERDKDYLFWHKPNVNWKLTDGYYNFTFITNKYGHRALSDEVSFSDSIVFVGDSIIEGASVENDETLSSVVQNRLNLATVNLGAGSSNTVQEYFLAENKILPSFNSKLLVLGFCLNDISQNEYRRYFDPSIGNWSHYDNVSVDAELTKYVFSTKEVINASLWFSLKEQLKKSEAIKLIYRIVKKLSITYGKKGPSIERYSPESWQNTEFFINKFASLSAQNGSDFIVIIFPTQGQLEGKVDLKDQIRLKEILKRNRIKYFDPFEGLLKVKQSDFDASNLYHDNVHPNKLGTLVIAEAFVQYLKSHTGLKDNLKMLLEN